MKILKLKSKKSKAQAMVEFAIALPILLLVLYGLIETGRLLFLISSVNNASRQAVRYGSTSGVGSNGVPRYQDCAGIRAAAQNSDFLNAFGDDDITISYDYGLPPYTPYDYCGSNANDHSSTTDVNVNADNEHRVNVTIEADFVPLVPLVSFTARTVANGNPIVSSSSRTLLLSIAISTQATATQSVTPSTTPTASNTPSQTPTASNTPTRTPSPQFSPTPSITSPATATFTRTSTSTPGATNLSCAITSYTLDSWNNGFNANITIRNNSSTPINGWTLTWNFPNSQQITSVWNATYSQSGTAASATNLSHNATISANGGTQSFGFQGTHTGTNYIPSNFKINGVSCTPPPVTACNTVTVGLLKKTSGNMTININNPLTSALLINNVTLQWNHDKGHQTGGDKSLILQSASIGGNFWTGSQGGATYTITPASATFIPIGASTMTFAFHQSFDNWDDTESVTINLSTPGCESVTLYQNQH